MRQLDLGRVGAAHAEEAAAQETKELISNPQFPVSPTTSIHPAPRREALKQSGLASCIPALSLTSRIVLRKWTYHLSLSFLICKMGFTGVVMKRQHT